MDRVEPRALAEAWSAAARSIESEEIEALTDFDGSRLEVLDQVHVWAECRHVVVLAFDILYLRLPRQWFNAQGKLMSNVDLRLKRLVWARLCEWQAPVLNQVRCKFCVENEVQCYRVTIPSPFGLALYVPLACTCCTARKRACKPGVLEDEQPALAGERSLRDVEAEDAALASIMARNHIGHGEGRARVRAIDSQPLSKEEKVKIFDLLIKSSLSGDSSLIDAHHRLWKALFPPHTAHNVWTNLEPAERLRPPAPVYSRRQSSASSISAASSDG